MTHKISHCAGAEGFPEAEEGVRGAVTQRSAPQIPFIVKVVAASLSMLFYYTGCHVVGPVTHEPE